MGRSRKTKRKIDPPDTAPGHDEPAGGFRGFNWLEHVGAAIGLFSLTAIAARVLIVSDYSSDTARALIQETGAVNVGLGAMVELLPVVAGFLWSVGVVVQLHLAFRRQQASTPAQWMGLAVMTTVAAGLAPLMYLASFLVLSLLMWQASAPNQTPNRGWSLRGPWMAVVATFMALMLMYGIASRTPWLPAERIDLQGRPQLTAYVLAEDHGTLTVLRERPRTVTRIDRDLVEDRAICLIEGEEPPAWAAWGQYPLARLVSAGTEPEYPACPTPPQ